MCAPLAPIMRTALLSILDFIAPPLCYHCDSRREGDRRGLCAACWEEIVRVHPADPLMLAHSAGVCAGGLIERLVAPFLFEEGGPLQSLLHELKYGEKSSIGAELGAAIGEVLLRLPPEDLPRFVVPVPLHRSRLRERGYNQSALIAAGVSRVIGVPLRADLLVRRRATLSQAALALQARKANVEGAFALGRFTVPVSAGAVALVDDVITTGSTIRACAAALRQAGIDRLFACAVAIAR